MNIIKKISQFPNQYLHDVGKRSYVEYLVKSLDAKDQPRAKQYFKELNTLQVASDPVVYFQKMSDCKHFLEEATNRAVGPDGKSKSYLFRNGSSDLFGYKPSGSKIWNYFPNPFGVFAYCQEQYWAVGRCVDLVRETIESDGFALKADPGVSPAKLTEYYKKLQQFNMEELWVEFPIHLMMFGNFYALPHKGTKSRKPVKFEILYPPRLVPIFDKMTAEVVQYEYSVGKINRYYDVDEVSHFFMPSLFGRELGTPMLLGSVVEIETALMTMNFNNNVMQKGGLIGKLVSLKSPDEDSGITSSVNSDWQREVQATFDFIHSGTKAGQGIAAMTGVENVFDITKPGEVELNFRESRDMLDKRIAQRLGIPSEKIGIPRSATAQYQPSLVENVVNAQYDTTINSYTAKAARFFTQAILKDLLDIHDAKFVPAGRYGAITLAAAQTIQQLSVSGPLTTVNEAREKILGWEPLPANDPRGNIIINNSTGQGVDTVPALLAPDQTDPAIDKIHETEGLFIKFGGKNRGEIFKHF